MSDRLQYPIVRITKCAECEHHLFAPILKRDLCYKDRKNGALIEDVDTIPDWCPLPKVGDLKKELGL